MLTFNGIDIEMEIYDEVVLSYLDSFFDFDSLMSYIKLTELGADLYYEDTQGLISSILMCTKLNTDPLKFDRFVLVCEEWDEYFYNHFTGFDREDINKAISVYVAAECERLYEDKIVKGIPNTGWEIPDGWL